MTPEQFMAIVHQQMQHHRAIADHITDEGLRAKLLKEADELERHYKGLRVVAGTING